MEQRCSVANAGHVSERSHYIAKSAAPQKIVGLFLLWANAVVGHRFYVVISGEALGFHTSWDVIVRARA